MRRAPLAVLAAALLLLQPLAALAEQKATIEEILDGPELYIDRNQARLNQKARAPQTISTGSSRGQIRFSSGASGRISSNSLMRLGQSCFLLSQGQVLISGPQNACTRSTRLSVRGTNFVVEIGDDDDTQLSVLEGSVDLERLRDGQPIPNSLPRLTAGQRLLFSESSGALSLTPLSRDDYAAILLGPLFRDFRTPLAERKRLRRHLRRTFPELLPLLSQVEDMEQEQSRPEEPPMPFPIRMPLPPSGAINVEPPHSWPRPDGRGRWPGPGNETSSCRSEVQSYYQSIARVYGDWRAPKPSRKGRFITRIDFDVASAGPAGPVLASNFVVTRASGEDAQDRSALIEARRKSRELPPPPTCTGGRLRVYHQFIVEYD
ncbi:MAG: FecR domain-containing protein [Synechococcaceae cyanobacterium]|nr:FecR domain-containing protein [Synechococcaceae cyanobacterium]